MSASTKTETEHDVKSAAKKTITLRTGLLIVAAVILTVFAVKNMEPVAVWPLGSDRKPVIIVIFISFVLGGLIGWLGRSITSRPALHGRE